MFSRVSVSFGTASWQLLNVPLDLLNCSITIIRNICSMLRFSACRLAANWEEVHIHTYTNTQGRTDTRSMSNASSTLRPETFYGANSASYLELYDGFATWLARALARADIFGALMRYKKPGFIEHAGPERACIAWIMVMFHRGVARTFSSANETFW